MMKDAYKNKYISIFGDSISTFEGINPKGYAVYYEYEYRDLSGVKWVDDTWWSKVIDHIGAKLLVNGSWSGCCVAKIPYLEEEYPSTCSMRRVEELSRNGISPDLIIIYLGTNDWGYCTMSEENTGLENFLPAYEKMMELIKERYPNAEIWCLSLNESFASAYPRFKFDPVSQGIHMDSYNAHIKACCEKYGGRYIDTHGYGVLYDSIDGIHPNKDGMNTLAELVIKEIEK
ncbi:MAG: hypothetical protein E7623_03685 [Ruminococcaceae bacterium]|nr:hypothetical protein [Oscillospiraceae bacterium]